MDKSVTSDTQRTSEEKVDLQLPVGNSGNGTNYGYQVQARYMYLEPRDFGGIILDQRWRTLYFEKSPIGVPTSRGTFDWFLPASSCMTKQAAEALRWWFLANCESGTWGGSLCVETRLVQFKIEYSHKAEAIAVCEQAKDAWRERL
jgi:hypothetical protein